MVRMMRITRLLGILLGGFVTLVGTMSLAGFVTESFWVHLGFALLVVVGLPAFVADRLLKRTKLGGGPAMVADIFAIVLLGVALVIVSAGVLSRPLLVREADLYAFTVATGALRRLTDRFGPDQSPAASPDGRLIAWVGYDDRKQG